MPVPTFSLGRLALSLALPLALALPAAPSFAAAPAAAAAGGMTRAQVAEKRAAVQGVSADAAAILSAIQADPALLQTLARDPQGGEALLRSHGATHAERIAVSSTGGGGGELKITITITIDLVVITIEL
jgi:hypothetical protein